MKKRMLSLILATFMLMSLFGAVYAADALTLEVNGKNIALEAAQAPYLQDGTVMAPLEALLDALGGRIAVTDPENNAMTIVVGSKMMNLVIGGKVYVTANLLQVGDKYTYDEPVKGEFSMAVTEKEAVVFIPLDDFCAIFDVESKTEGTVIKLIRDIPQEPGATATPDPSATSSTEPTPTPTIPAKEPTAAPSVTPAPVPEEISVYIDGEKIEFDVPPMLINDRTMVPIRYISEALGAVVDWNEELQEVTITKDGVVNQLILGNPSARKTADGIETEITLETAPFTTNDRTMVPLRYISESFGMEVQWVDDTQTVLITTPAPAPSPSLAPEVTPSPSPAAAYFEEAEKKVVDLSLIHI